MMMWPAFIGQGPEKSSELANAIFDYLEIFQIGNAATAAEHALVQRI